MSSKSYHSSSSSRLCLRALQVMVLSTTVLLLLGPVSQAGVEAGKKEKILLGLAVGHALSSRARDHSLLRLIIPLRFAAEAWKKFGEVSAHHKYDDYGHHGHGGYGGHLGGFHGGFDFADQGGLGLGAGAAGLLKV